MPLQNLEGIEKGRRIRHRWPDAMLSGVAYDVAEHQRQQPCGRAAAAASPREARQMFADAVNVLDGCAREQQQPLARCTSSRPSPGGRAGERGAAAGYERDDERAVGSFRKLQQPRPVAPAASGTGCDASITSMLGPSAQPGVPMLG